jgi:hypothetical protein
MHTPTQPTLSPQARKSHIIKTLSTITSQQLTLPQFTQLQLDLPEVTFNNWGKSYRYPTYDLISPIYDNEIRSFYVLIES